ncbi:MAG: hypothetical protein IJN64_10510 [Lachnospiraceae bacterium]|nr:hypothetical protein [Lachnospiraceae bacterium]
MNWMEAALLILGIGAFVASFIIPEKKNKEEKIQEIDVEVIRKLIEKEMEAAKSRVSEVVDETLEYAVEKTERASERISNEKIMAISEYSETVLADMNKTHQEIMFLYDMLNDKHENLKETAKQVDKQAKEAEEKANAAATALAAKEEASAFLEKQVQLTTQVVEAKLTEAKSEETKKEDIKKVETTEFVPMESKPLERITLDKIFGDNIPTEVVAVEQARVQVQTEDSGSDEQEERKTPEEKNVEVYSFVEQAPHVERPEKREDQAVKLEDSIQAMKQQEERKEVLKGMGELQEPAVENNNDKILRMYKEGMSNVDIAKELGLGVGEVKLVINLFKGA